MLEDTLGVNDVRIEMRIKNNVLWSAIHKDYASITEFCQKNDVSPMIIGNLINFRYSPFSKRGDKVYKPVCYRVQDALGVMVEDLFPRDLYEGIVSSHAVLETSSVLLLPLELKEVSELEDLSASPLDVALKSEVRSKVDQALQTLSPRERQIIELRFGLKDDLELTLDQIGQRTNISRERVAQILRNAFNKLRHPSVRQVLLCLYEQSN